jgi:hypothetical protein
MMKNEFYEITIKLASSEKIDLEISFSDKEIPETEIRRLEEAIRLLLEACGRICPNPSRR